MNKYVVIVAGGSGTRMGSEMPKQFLPLNGLPVLMHTIQCFYNYSKLINIIVVLPDAEIERWEQLCKNHVFAIKHTSVNGGFTRFHSVKNALALIKDKSLVAIHDGVRPLVSQKTIELCFDKAEQSGAAIPVLECFESIRKINESGSTALDRSLYRLVQTPQVFSSDLLLDAYNQAYLTRFTDDASVVESNGQAVALVEGNRENIKITTPDDLYIAEIMLSRDLFLF